MERRALDFVNRRFLRVGTLDRFQDGPGLDGWLQRGHSAPNVWTEHRPAADLASDRAQSFEFGVT